VFLLNPSGVPDGGAPLPRISSGANIKPALANQQLQETIRASAKSLGFTIRAMQSGAIHDSQNMSLLAPMGMIFVPSVGVSVICRKNLRKVWI
jgi:hypothetical protein